MLRDISYDTESYSKLVVIKDYECVRHRINFHTDTLNDFPSRLSTSENQPFFINNRGFTERYFSDKVHASLIEDCVA